MFPSPFRAVVGRENLNKAEPQELKWIHEILGENEFFDLANIGRKH
jgi:hypothetical protein